MEMIKKLVETLGFEVDCFDEPDINRPPIQLSQQRIASADCVVIIIGPKNREETISAPWPAEEGVYAIAKEKPVALFIHPNTQLPESLQNLQTPARFNFWDINDQMRNIHNILKHLLDLKRRIDLPPGTQPFLYTKSISRNRISRTGSLTVQIYSEVVARQECSRFHHALDTGLDNRKSAIIKLVNDNSYYIETTLGSESHRASIEIAPCTDQQIPYFVNVEPPLAPGERLGYQREFEVQNWFPLTQVELKKISEEPGFPLEYIQDGKIYYGDVYDVFYEMEAITLAIHIPRRYPIKSIRALALSSTARTLNVGETEKINKKEVISLVTLPESSEQVICLNVRPPLINHRYALLYEPE